MSQKGRRHRWPEQLQPGAVRLGRASGRYEATVAFYRDLLGLPVVDEFHASFGEDGTVFGLPDTTVQLEIIRAREPVGAAEFDQLVFYLESADAVRTATAPLVSAGVVPSVDQHAYWAANGAVTVRDPDGREVVFAPWVSGRDPEPADTAARATASDAVRVGWYDGDRNALRALLSEAEDSPAQLNAYIDAGRVLVARCGDDVIGHLQLVPAGPDTVELKNMAVVEEWRGAGVGRSLVEAALAAAADEGAITMVVATAAADIGNLRFYQRCGFRFVGVDRDAFTAATGYPEQLDIDGVPLRDRVWLDQPLPPRGTDR